MENSGIVGIKIEIEEERSLFLLLGKRTQSLTSFYKRKLNNSNWNFNIKLFIFQVHPNESILINNNWTFEMFNLTQFLSITSGFRNSINHYLDWKSWTEILKPPASMLKPRACFSSHLSWCQKQLKIERINFILHFILQLALMACNRKCNARKVTMQFDYIFDALNRAWGY